MTERTETSERTEQPARGDVPAERTEHTDPRPAEDAPTRDRVTRDRVDRAPGEGTVRERQRDEYGGFNIGAAFFGWLVAVGLAVLLTALLSAAGAAIGLTDLSEDQARSNAETISIVGGILLVLVLALSYYAG